MVRILKALAIFCMCGHAMFGQCNITSDATAVGVIVGGSHRFSASCGDSPTWNVTAQPSGTCAGTIDQTRW